MSESIKITWRDGTYYVDRPNWDGGEVTLLSDYVHLDSKLTRIRAIANAWVEPRKDASTAMIEILKVLEE